LYAGRGAILVQIYIFVGAIEELGMRTKEAEYDIDTKYGAQNIVHEAPGCIVVLCLDDNFSAE